MSDLPASISRSRGRAARRPAERGPGLDRGEGRAARRAVSDRRTTDRGGELRPPEGDPADGGRRRGLGSRSPATTTSATPRWCPTCVARSGRSAPASARSRSSCRRPTPTTARTSTAAPTSRSTRSRSWSTLAHGMDATRAGDRRDRVGLSVRGRRTDRAGGGGRRPRDPRRRRRDLVRRHDGHGDAGPGDPADRRAAVRPPGRRH